MVIYKITNLLNGKFYIGQDIKNDVNYFGSGILIKKAIKKYGKKNFKKEILEFCSTKEELDYKEIFYINELKAIENGYNISIGGTGGPNFVGKNHSEETKKRLKEVWEKRKKEDGFTHNMTGFKHNQEVKEKMSKSRKGKYKGENNPMYGKKHSEESRKKMGKPMLGENNPMYGKKQSEDTKKNISKKVIGENNHFFGRKHSVESKKKISEKLKNKGSVNGKKIKINEYVFNSMIEASEKLDISRYLLNKKCFNKIFNCVFID